MAFTDRIAGLLGNPAFNVGIGLLSAGGPSAMPVNIGQGFAHAMQFASERERAAMENRAMRQALLQQQRQQRAQEQLQGLLAQTSVAQAPGTQVTSDDPLGLNVSIPGRKGLVPTLGTPQGQQQLMGLLGQIAPTAVAEGLLGQMFATQEFASPIGKMLGDLEIAEARGNGAAAEQIRAAIEQELGDDVELSEVRSMRNDLIRNSEAFLEQQRGFQNVISAARNPSPASDLALLFGVMKILDPGSIVREGEVQLTQGAGSLAQRIAGEYQRVFHGERLTAAQRADFVNMAQTQFKSASEHQLRMVDDARKFATRNDLPLADVVPEFVVPQPFEPVTFKVPETSEPPTRTLENPLTPSEMEELNSLRRQLGLGGN